jgi:hypothetical protein
VRIDADAGESELGHVRAAHEHCARRLEPGNDWRVQLGRWRIVKRPRARERALARDIEEILDRDRNSRQR